jgi:hypothetical protein
MKIMQIVFTGLVLGLAATAFAGDETKMKMSVVVIDDAADGEIRIELDSDDLDFDLHGMQEGENRSIVDKSGRTILISRNADGFSFDVDGKTIDLPVLGGEHHGGMWIGDDGGDDVKLHFIKKGMFGGGESMDGIMIMSGKPIDEATQQAIKTLLESSGYDSDVDFMDHSGPHGGPHRIEVIRKHVEVTK